MKKYFKRVFIGFILILVIFVFYVVKVTEGGAYIGPPSDHFKDGHFRNRQSVPPKGLLRYLRSRGIGSFEKWPDWVEDDPQVIRHERVARQALSITFVNHATVLIQIDGMNLMTDPIFSERASPVSYVGPIRHRDPGIMFEDIPPIDVVLISHDHYDHMDMESLVEIEERDHPLFLTGLGNSVFLYSYGIKNVGELDWWQGTNIDGLSINFIETQHFAGRGIFNTMETLWGGFVIEGKAHKVHFIGDSGFSPHFKEIHRRFGPPDIALIPIGAYEPRSFMKTHHINPEEAVRAHIDLKSKKSMGIHFGTFQMTMEGINDPIEDLEKAREFYDISASDFFVPGFGQSYEIPWSGKLSK